MALSKITNASVADTAVHGRRRINQNGAMTISQRGSSFAIAHQSATYTLDRYKIWEETGGSCTISQSSTAPSGFTNSFKVDITGADTSLAASEHCVFYQNIEAQDLQHLEFGTSSAKTLSVSFWVRSNKTGTYILNIFKPDQTTQMMSKSYTINSADTWEKKVISIPACTSSGIDNNNGTGLQFIFYLATGTAFSSGTLQTTWGSDTVANRAVGQVNLFDSTNNEWYMTGLQIEVGDASPFEHRSHGEELALCQRYYFQETKPIYGVFTVGRVFNSKTPQFGYSFPVPMRTLPSISNVGSGCGVWFSSGSETQLSNPSFYQDNTSGTDLIKGSLVFSANSNLSDNNGVALCSHAADSGLAFSAEL